MLNKKVVPYVLVMPFLLFFATFRVGPILSSIWMSLLEWKSITPVEFIGLKNYLVVLKDGKFLLALKNTLFFVGVYNAIMILLALSIAVVIHFSTIRGGRLFRTVYFLPVCMSLAVVALVFDLIYSKKTGFLNMFLGMLHLPRDHRWLDDPNLTMWSIIAMRVWRASGYYAAFLFAGLKGIPTQIYDASKVDGASSTTTFIYITLPLLKRMLLFVIIMSSIWSFQLFDEVWVLTQGGPAGATLTLQIYLYQHSFLFGKIGMGAAVSYIMALLMIVSSLFYSRMLRTKD